MSYIHKETFRVRTSEINLRKEIHPHHLIQLMQESSMQHTLGMKVSVWDLESRNVSWVLLKKHIQFFRFPLLGEQVEIHTYPSGLDGYFTYRDYYVYDEKGNVCANASSMWTLMDTVERKMVKIPAEFGSLVYQTDYYLPKPSQKLKIPSETDMPYEVKVNYLHLDWNGHVNNVQLIKMIFESLNEKILQNRILSSFTIQFKSEATLGQNLAVRSQHISDNEIIHAIKNKDTEKDIILATTIWK
jgi:medium-chain acyl-[acyl-carrier-protein] hydrolase